MSNPIEIKNRWLKGIPCSPPCWEGITPEKTRLNEAIQLLKVNPFIKGVVVTALNDGVVWNWDRETTNIVYQGKITYSDNQVVNTIEPGFDQTFYLLGEVIKAYGEPDFVLATAGQNVEGGGLYYFLAVIFSGKGFAVQMQGTVQNAKLLPYISENTTLNNGVVFFAPGQATAFKTYNQSAGAFFKWQSYNPFDYYCQPVDLGQIKNCNDIPTY